MYVMGGRIYMTFGDIDFLKAVGIEPCSLGDPSPGCLPPPPVPEAPIPKLTEEDSRWLQDLRVAWEVEPEPEFMPPKTLHEYFARCPTGIRDAVGEVAKEMGLDLPDGGLDGLAQEITQMWVDFAALGLEDVVELYGYYKSMRPGLCGVGGFHAYVKLRVAACVPVVLKDDPHGESNG
jgi:hypothetical protein